MRPSFPPSRSASAALRLLPLVLFAAVSACTPARTATRPDVPARPAAPRVELAATETFDPSAYPADAPESAVPAVAHDVPQTLLDNATAAAPERPDPAPVTAPPDRPSGGTTLRTITGYRVQIFQSSNKDEADRRVADAMTWWRRANGGTPEIYTVYRAPYYRVRIGNYATRGEAVSAARSVGGTFPGSFVVQDRVTVRQ